MKISKTTIFFFLIIGITFITSCNRGLRYFNQEMVDEYKWNNAEIKKIQFYLSEDIVLWRKLKKDDTQIKNGKIRIEDDSKVEEVIIKKNTPGVVLFIPKKNKYAVSFDSDEDHFLMFGPNPKNKDKYVLLAKDWDRRRGKVTYGKVVYSTNSESAFAGLLVDIKTAKNIKYNSKTASGRRIRK
ncbi:MAG: PH domain-containing protein [Saprospiraceae bacterium]